MWNIQRPLSTKPVAAIFSNSLYQWAIIILSKSQLQIFSFLLSFLLQLLGTLSHCRSSLIPKSLGFWIGRCFGSQVCKRVSRYVAINQRTARSLNRPKARKSLAIYQHQALHLSRTALNRPPCEASLLTSHPLFQRYNQDFAADRALMSAATLWQDIFRRSNVLEKSSVLLL